MDNYIGRLLDNRYEILEVIGTGGMAVVYKARDHRLKRLVAVKILKDEYSQDDEFRRRFKAESQAVAMLSHPNIVSVYDVNSLDGVDYIVMELIDGITLKQYMERRGQLNWRETLHFSMQICKALEHAHGRGIIHRDIKPHNIMILKDGSVKVADFGIARMTSAQNTLTREALGSVHYISPEQAKGSKADCRSDLYSLGVVMYEMMTARTPFDGDTPVSVAIQHINGKAQPPRELNPDIPVGLEQITMHAMTADLSRRYASASDMLNDLEEFRKNPAIIFHFVQPAAAAQTAAAAAVRTQQARTTTARTTQAQRTENKPRPHNVAEVYGADENELPEEETKTKKGPVIAAVILSLLAIAGVAYLLFAVLLPGIFGKNKPLTVPNFVGMSFEDIYPAEYPEFQFEAMEWKNDEELAYGYIIEQTPQGDTEATEGTTIYLTISLGPKDNTMPPLTNMNVADATKLLDDMDLGLMVVLDNIPSSDYEKGIVINSDPVSGVKLEKGQSVTLYVSAGVEEEVPEIVTVPKVTDLPLNEAISELQNAKLSVGNIRNVASEEERGMVVNQSVAQGTQIESGTKIDLQVSLGPEDEEPDEPSSEEPDEPDQPTEPEQPGEQPTEPEQPGGTEDPGTSGEPTVGRAKVPIRLPDQEGTIRLTLMLDGQQVSDDEDVPCEYGTVNAELRGTGTMTLDVYYDGVWAYSEQVTFE